MLLKIILFLAAAIPIILFVRALFFNRPTRIGRAMAEFKRQVDFGIYVLLAVIAVVAAVAVARLAWAWWTAA
jgi:hypothetical protein